MNARAVLLFDGVCNFCNGAVRFVAERDARKTFRFASLQSDEGREILRRCGLPSDEITTIVVVEGDRCWTASDAALRVAGRLSGAWPLLGVLRIVPRFLRDRAYRWFARHRYEWFGRSEACLLETEDTRDPRDTKDPKDTEGIGGTEGAR